MNLTNIAKAAIAATAITICSLGIEMPAKAFGQKMCYQQASYFNPDYFNCQRTGMQDQWGNPIWICCQD